MKFIRSLVGLIFLLIFTGNVFADESTTTMTQEKQQAMTPQQAVERLQEGNQRFLDGNMKNRDLLDQANDTAKGQYPFAIVLSCLDSRSTPEYIFDQGVGDLFVARVAGNIQNSDILGSMEFGTKLAGAKAIVVMGHTNCGAVRGACGKAKLGNLTGLLQKIQPAVTQTAKTSKTHDCSDYGYIDEIAKNNVLMVVKQIQQNSSVIKKLVAEKKLVVIGAMQDLSTGKVTFLS
jgi:carbonic anhydrase